MASLPAEEKVEFLINVLATCHEFKPNYDALAKKTGINTKSNAQRRLKVIVEADKRFALQSSAAATKVIDTSVEDGAEQATPVKTPKPRKRTKKDGMDDEEKGSPTKKGRKTKAMGAEEDSAEDAKEEGEAEGEDAI